MIDIHCHILPTLDDGAKSMDETFLMAKEAVRNGIHTIIATPHHNDQYQNSKEKIVKEVQVLNQAFQSENIDLTVLPGQEPRIFGEMITAIESHDILSLNYSQYVFVELPSDHVPRYTEILMYDMLLKGYVPIIVHPERNKEIMENPNLLYNLVKKGALTQVTAASITGHFGKKIKAFSHQLIRANLTHFIASDAHNTTNRTFNFAKAFDTVKSEFGSDYVYLFTENANILPLGQNVIKEIPERVKTKKFLGIF